MDILSSRLKHLRKAKAVFQKEVSESISMSERRYIDLENGKASPSGENLIKLADYFNVPIDFLTGRIKYIKKGEPIMDYNDIIEIFETNNSNFVNEYLKLGWQLLEISKAIGSADMQMNSYNLYCLGWNSSKGEVVHPIPDNPDSHKS